MEPGQIRVTGARQHNLKNLSLTLPRRAITAFTGVSGSGKSSLVFDTIAAEAQRQLNETLTAFVRNRLPSYGRPDVDTIEDLSPVVVLNQRRLGGNARSTVGTITDSYALLRHPASAPVVHDLVERLEALDGIGLGYLNLGRATTTLSGGESQRIRWSAISAAA